MSVTVNFYATVRELPELDFPHRLNSHRDQSDPALGPHLQGFMGFVMQGGQAPMTQTRYHVLRHIQRVQHQVSAEVEDDQLGLTAPWAQAANAVVFLPDATIRDPQGRILVDATNPEPPAGAEVPHPPDAVERAQRNMAWLQQQGIPCMPLPPVVGAVEVELRSPADVVRRAMSLLAVALRAESINQGDPIPVQQLAQRLPHGFDAQTLKEIAFLNSDAPPPQDVINHAWRYECVRLLEWALGLLPELPLPVSICDVPSTAQTLMEADAEELLGSASLRPTAEILDALDLHVRLNWAAREARRSNAAPPAGLNPGVIEERHRTLNWLVRFEDADWDDVDTPT